ncbi:MAG: hypothetical protein H0T43_01080 [Solirubrobacterales bacterium]|nr:hypothetical protein [Solirubrobacterales bacterium]
MERVLAIRIHRGTHEVGGTCIELAADGERIVLDAGMPMTPPRRCSDLLPDVPGLWAEGDGSLRGLFISHPHPDHYGLADLVDDDVPIFMGPRAQAVLRESSFFIPWAPAFPPALPLEHRVPVELGPFTVTPWRVDHGAEDCFALLVEAAGSRVLYSGDWRGHGPHPETVEEIVANVGRLDTLLVEGTRIEIGGDDHHISPTEAAVEQACVELIAAARRGVVAFASAQNFDRLDSLQRAAHAAGREFVLDLYAASLWIASGRPRDAIRVFATRPQRRRIYETEAFERTRAVRDLRIFPEEIAERPEELVLCLRTSAVHEIEDTGVLLDADVIWSMWEGYLQGESMASTRQVLRRNGARVSFIHTSGHATATDLEAFVRRVDAREVVPIHTRSPHICAGTFPGARLRTDGEWWDVAREPEGHACTA